MSQKLTPEAIEALLLEHDEIVQLFMHEDNRAWQLNLAVAAANGTLAAFLLQTYSTTFSTSAHPFFLNVICLAGFFLNLLMFFVFQRSKIHWWSRLSRAIQIEQIVTEELSTQPNDNFQFDTLLSAEGHIFLKHQRLVVRQRPGRADRFLLALKRVFRQTKRLPIPEEQNQKAGSKEVKDLEVVSEHLRRWERFEILGHYWLLIPLALAWLALIFLHP